VPECTFCPLPAKTSLTPYVEKCAPVCPWCWPSMCGTQEQKNMHWCPTSTGEKQVHFFPRWCQAAFPGRRQKVHFVPPAPQNELDTLGEESASVFPPCWSSTFGA